MSLLEDLHDVFDTCRDNPSRTKALGQQLRTSYPGLAAAVDSVASRHPIFHVDDFHRALMDADPQLATLTDMYHAVPTTVALAQYLQVCVVHSDLVFVPNKTLATYAIEDRMDALRSECCDFVLLDVEDLHRHFTGGEITWITRTGEQVGDSIGWGIRNVNDALVAHLLEAGRPLTLAEFTERLDRNAATGSVRNALTSDDRIWRTSVSTWGLKAWGGHEYSGGFDMLRTYIAQHPDGVPVDTAVAYLADFGVRPTTARSYTRAPYFRIERGRMFLADTSKLEPARDLGETAHVYRTARGWVCRKLVTQEHLRGSGSPAPRSFVHALGVPFGTPSRIKLQGPMSLSVSWSPSQATFGSLKEHLEAAGAVEGDCVMIYAYDTPGRSAKVVVERRKDHGPASWLCATVGAADHVDAVAAARIALQDPDGDLDALADAFVRKHDEDLAAALREAVA